MSQPAREAVVILDFGSQYSQLIARRVRELEVYCELVPHDATAEAITQLNPLGFILSGGPASVYAPAAPQLPDVVLKSEKPVLGICYGMQLLTVQFGGQVDPGNEREYGLADVALLEVETPLFKYVDNAEMPVWMSHGDRVTRLPDNFKPLAQSAIRPLPPSAMPPAACTACNFTRKSPTRRRAKHCSALFCTMSVAATAAGHPATSSKRALRRYANKWAVGKWCAGCPAESTPRWWRRCCIRPSARN